MIKKLNLSIVFILLLSTRSFAQNWGGGVDDEDLHFGFSFQYVASEYKILKRLNWQEPYFSSNEVRYVTDSLRAIYGKVSPGFGIGFVVDYRLGGNANLRLTPSLVFNDRLLNYQYRAMISNQNGQVTDQNVVQQKVQATMVDLPLAIKIKSDRINNFRAYMLGGVKYSFDLASAKKTNDAGNSAIDKLLKNRKNFFSYEAGIGFDLYFEYFKMSPEIKLSYSLNSVLKPESGNPYVSPIDKLMLRHVTFSLFFE